MKNQRLAYPTGCEKSEPFLLASHFPFAYIIRACLPALVLGASASFSHPAEGGEPESTENDSFDFVQAASAEEPDNDSDSDSKKEDLQSIMERFALVSAASKYQTRNTEAPSSVTVILRDDIKKHGYQTLADLLRSVRSMHVSYDRNYSYLGTRGFNRGDFNSRMLVLVNGHRMNNNVSDGARIGTAFLLDVDLIERVEIVRGPGSVVYGNNAFFGVINVVTRQGGDIGDTVDRGHAGEASGSYGEFNTYRGRATYGHKELFQLAKSPVSLMLSGSYFHSDGQDSLLFREFRDDTPSRGIARNRDEDEFFSGFGSLVWRDFQLDGGYLDRSKENPTAPVGSAFNDPRTETTDRRGYANLRYDNDHMEFLDEIMARVYYDSFRFDAFVPFDDPLPNNIQEQRGDWWGAEFLVRKEFTDWYQAVLGAEYQGDLNQEIYIEEQNPKTPVLNVDENRDSVGVYLQNRLQILPKKVSLDAGVRYDYFSTFGDTVNPRVGLFYNPWGTNTTYNTTCKAVYGTAFRAPNVLELVLEPNLDPETIHTYEFIWEQDYLAESYALKSTVNFFYNEIDDLITRRQAGGLRNAAGADTLGVEFGLQGFWLSGYLRTRVSYTYQHTEDNDTGERLTDSPRHLAKLSVSVPLYRQKDPTLDYPKSVFAGLEARYVGDRQTILGTTAPDYAVLNFNLYSLHLLKNLEASAGVFNLFDTEYEDPTPLLQFHRQRTIEQDGRTYYVQLTYRF